MENPFEIILERLEKIEIAIQKLKLPTIKDDKEVLLSRIETATLLKFSLTTLWKHTKSGKLKSYGIGNRVFYKKDEVLKSLTRIN
ncbi:helix-turn-helix domain-containing protein [Flavobacterium frigoris]|nr:helix-turn-helix domain-containing protein [Flavobacterium frigoris]